jgi:hypothetical protein
MKRFIVTKEQLNEYIEKKKSEKIFNQIIEDLNKNAKLLSENVSHSNANQSVINNYNRKNLITPRIQEMLIKKKIINEKYEII